MISIIPRNMPYSVVELQQVLRVS